MRWLLTEGCGFILGHLAVRFRAWNNWWALEFVKGKDVLSGMEYLIGLIASLATAASGKVIGFDRDRAFYPTVLIVVATYYILFAVMGAPRRTLVLELIFASAFFGLAVLGFRWTMWVVVVGLIAHGLFDFVRVGFIHNPGVPSWWPGFCLAYDLPLGVVLGLMLMRQPKEARR